MRRSLKQLVPVVFMIAILRETDSSLSFADGSNQTNAAAQQIAHRLHEVFEKNLGFNRLQSLYDSLSCVNQTTDVKRLLNSITDPAAARLNASVKFLQELSATLHQLSSKTHHENVTECCKYLNGTSVTTFFSERLRSLVDTTTGCSIKHSALSGERESFILNAELSKRFKDNFKGSPVVAWQYYGSIDGEYIQYPGNTRHCEGTSSAQFDPRFKSWYVETASPVKKNLVIIVDRSGSMSGLRMLLAKDAAVTVLDTLSAQDNVGILAFSRLIKTPSGCFGATVAKGIPANLAKMKQWTRKLTAFGLTYYAKAFKSAFKMFENVTRQGSGRTNIILFLTDGDPSDTEAEIYQAIDEGQASMNHTVQINTYALGTGLSHKSLQRLKTIAYNNSGVFVEISDQREGVLKRIMGSYYTSINIPIDQKARISDPFMDSKLGLTVTVSVALIHNESLKGVLALDLPLDRLFKEALRASSNAQSYAILVNKEGRTILHPSLPSPTDTTSSRSFLPLSLFEASLPDDIISNITHGGSGEQCYEAGFPVLLGDRSTDGTHIFYRNATYIWTPVRKNAYYIVLVVADGQSIKTDFTSFKLTRNNSPSLYHRLDLWKNISDSYPSGICSSKESLLISPTSSSIKISPEAFNDSDEFIYNTETIRDVQNIQRFFNENVPHVRFKGLSEAIRAEVMMTSELEDFWKRAELTNQYLVTWRFVGTQQGVLRTFPGIRLQKTYSHLQQSWYRQASSTPEMMVVSLRNSAYQQDKVLSLSKAIPRTSSAGVQFGDNQARDVLAVMGMEMTKHAFVQLITEKVDFEKDCGEEWYIVERSGQIMMNLSRSTSLKTHKGHLTDVFPWLASQLIKKDKNLKTSWCNDYQQHTVQLFYELINSADGASSKSSDPCLQFSLNQIQGTSLFLLSFPSRSLHNCTDRPTVPNEDCFCEESCRVCSTNAVSVCQCPCSCHMSYDECENSVTSLWTSSPCPVSVPPLFDTDKEDVALKDALASAPRCARDCVQIANISECGNTLGCHWCSEQEVPLCSSECRTSQSLSMFVRFPCQNFMSLLVDQQNTIKYLFKTNLLRLVSSTSPLNIGVLQLQKDGIVVKLQATTSNSDLKTMQETIEHLVNQGKVVLGPAADIRAVYTARSPKEFTDLHVLFTLDQALPQPSQEKSNIKAQLESILSKLVGSSLVSRIRRLCLNKTSIRFSLSNEGETVLHPINEMKTRLERLVKLGKISFEVPLITGSAVMTDVSVVNISSGGTFDFLCHPYTSSTSAKTTSPQSTRHVESSTMLSGTISPSDKDDVREQGLTPVEIGIVVGVSALAVSALHCILFALCKRGRRENKKRTVSPEGNFEDELPSELSDLSEMDTDTHIALSNINTTYEPTRIHLSPREAWARARELTIQAPQQVPKGAWF